MTTFVLTSKAPAEFFIIAGAVVTVQHLLETGTLGAYTLRENNTMRHLELAPVGSTRRDTAEWISEQLDEGMTVKALARELHSSVATVRRFLLSLELTEQIEAGEWDDLVFDSTGEPAWQNTPECTCTVIHWETEDRCTCGGYPAQEAWDDVPGATCEPTGTTGDALAGALADSLVVAGVVPTTAEEQQFALS